MRKIIEAVLIYLNERKEARLYREWLRNKEDQEHTEMLDKAHYLASRASYKHEEIEFKKAA